MSGHKWKNTASQNNTIALSDSLKWNMISLQYMVYMIPECRFSPIFPITFVHYANNYLYYKAY